MTWKPIDMAGKQYGRWTAISKSHVNATGKLYWNCVCSCGTKKAIWGASLRNGISKSCGCYNSERTIKQNTKHGRSGTSEYNTWLTIQRRCYEPTFIGYANYGGRGIAVCASWRDSFEAFFADMGLKPSKAHTIDRKNTNGNYEPDNCCWATRTQQANNKRNNVLLTLADVTLTVSQWAVRTGMATNTIWTRLRLHWPVERALTAPIRHRPSR